MNHKRIILLTTCFILSLVLGLSILGFAVDEPEANTEAEQHYEKAYELRKAADYDAAIAEYEKAISSSPNSKIAQNAQYWIGQSYFESKQFDAALSAFQELLDKYPASSIAQSAKQMIEHAEQAKKNRALFEAAKKADIEQVKLLIAGGADVDAEWQDSYKENEGEDTSSRGNKWRMERTPLWHAVHVGKSDVVRLLVEAGADVNAGEWPPLCQAVDENNAAIAEYLIDHGANVDYPQNWGPLLEAIQTDSIEMVKLLIEKGADVNATSHMPPPLQLVVLEVRRGIFDLLIQRGADVNVKDKWGYTALYMAIHNDDSYFMNTLIDHGAEVNATYGGGETLLQSAAMTGRTESVKALLEAGANIDAVNDRGQTALHAPLDIKNSNYKKYKLSKDTLELLLDKGADVNSKDKAGRTPLHLAAESADTEIVGLLLEKGAKVNEKDDESGFTALHYAARLGKKDVTELLLTRGADINAKDNQGHTPLYISVSRDSEVAEFLIDKGADTSIRTESGQTLLQLIQKQKQVESSVPDMIFDGKQRSLLGSLIACGDVDGDEHDDILIAAVGEDNRRGRVYLFYGGPDMDTTADLVFEGQDQGDWFGRGIACGDIDNDGYEDIIIAADDGYNEKRGRVYLYWGSDRDSMDADPDKVFVGEERRGSRLGVNSPVIHDIDNDGYKDVILGSFINQDDALGRVYLHYGNTKELMDTSHDLVFAAKNFSDQHAYGLSIACGDIDDDHYGDIVIGSQFSPFNRKKVRAHLYYGDSRSRMNNEADVVFEVESEGAILAGRSIVCVDQNGDGCDDIFLGAHGYNERQGRAFLFHGNSKRDPGTDPDLILDGEFKSSSYGHNAVCGDIDGDNVNDLIIGARDFKQGVGRVYVYSGKELAGPSAKPARILTGEDSKNYFGQGLACGDINNDGFDDLVIGAYGYKPGANQGRAYLYYGGPRNK